MLIVINKKKFKKTKGNIFVMFIWFCNLKMSHLFLMKKHKLKTFKVKSLTLSINSNQHTLNRADFFNQNPWDFKV